jgi:hypothetical protein
MNKKETSINVSFPGFNEILKRLEKIERLLEQDG